VYRFLKEVYKSVKKKCLKILDFKSISRKAKAKLIQRMLFVSLFVYLTILKTIVYN